MDNTKLQNLINDYSLLYKELKLSLKAKDKARINELMKSFKAQNLLGKTVKYL